MRVTFTRFILAFAALYFGVAAFAQNNSSLPDRSECPGVLGACGYQNAMPANNPNNLPAANSGPNPSPQNGNGTLGVIYDVAKCGLDYTTASQRLGKRGSLAGVNQPAPFVIAGIPACAVIEKAYLWAEGSGNGAAQTATVAGPFGTANFPMAIVGQGPDKCWGYSGSYTYRADVTSVIGGNGTYNISGILTNPPTSGNDMDGATLCVIWSLPSANFQGRVIIADGAYVVNGGVANYNMPINPAVCGATTGGKGFMCVGDIQFNPTSWSINGTAMALGWNWWDCRQTATAFAAAQASCNFNVNTGGDCFNLCVAAAYFRTTTCAACPTTSALTITTSSTQATCSNCNGSATVTGVTGGSGPYTYSWAPSGGTGATATGLCPGTYTVTVTANAGCLTSTAAVTITSAGGGLTLSGTQTNVLCNGQCTGSATNTVTGGTAPFTFTWSPAAANSTVGNNNTGTGLCAGTYTVNVTDVNGCTGSRTFTITQPTALTATQTQTNVLCNGGSTGSAAVTASGGTPGYTYSWAPSGGTGATATGLAAGNYTCTITDANGCFITRTFSITQPTALSATQSQTNILCNGGTGSAAVTPSGGTPGYTYSWAPSGGTGATATGLTVGNYTCTITDANGCVITRTFSITQPTALTATQSQTNILCNGASTGSASVSASGGTPGYTYSWAPSGGTGATATGLAAGNYTCTITDANGCVITRTFSITQPTALTATATSTAVLCFGGNTGSAAVTAGGGSPGYTYSWAPSGGTGATASSLTAGTYTVTVTDANSCTVTATTTITEPPQLTVAVTTIPSTCGNANGSASATQAGGTGPYSFNWTPGNVTTATLPNVLAGNYQITVTDANGCAATAIATINNMGNPVASILASDSVSCFGGNDGWAAAAASSGTGPYSYLWSNNDADSLAGNLTVGSYTVTVTDANGCTDTASVTIFEPTQLTATTTQVDVLCFGNSTGSATVSAAGGTPVYSYSWTSGGTAATENNLAAGSYTCTITDANGCTTTASVTITEPPQLTATTTQVDELCFGGTNGSATVTPAGGSPAYTYLWTSGGTAATESNLAAGSYTCTITDANGCTTTASVTLTEPTAVVASATAVDAHCNQSDGSATGSATGGTGSYTYTWLPSGSGATLSNIPAGSYSVIVTDANGCADTAAISVLNLNGVNASLVSSNNISCFGGNDGDITINATGGNPTYTYSWTPNVSSSATANTLTAGNYQVVVTDLDGCTSTVSVTLTQPTALTITAAANPAAVCEGTPVSLSSTPSGGTPAYTITWNPGALAGQNQTLIPAATTTYTVDVTDANGCTANATVLVTVNAMPSAALTADVTEGCAPLCVNFLDSSLLASGTITSWQWNFGDNNTSTSQNPSHCYSTPGTYNVSLTVTTAAGCTGTINMNGYIHVYTNPIAGFSATPQPTTILNSTVYFTDTSSAATSWNWSFGDVANSTSTAQNPNFTYPDPTCYSVVLTVSSADGCVDTATQIICIDPDVSIYVPNTFTPNEDGTNDVFYPVTIGIDPDKYELWIFDRWGNMIFYTDDLNDGWDGRVQGSADICQIDTYVWKIKAIDVLGKKHNLIGHVNLIK
ncbi:MAG: hypothetical protein Fur0041_02490 [Bacteroidia bacterium]